ncbi:MAG: hypothetical protein KJO80_07540 [Gammaproteobacteria bacterium]|nr:hypothetical protein [Gammaproteobacteria bacterium]
MIKRKIFKIGFALAIAAVPFHTYAVTKQAGLEACAEAMVNDLATRQNSPMVLNLDPSSKGGKGKLRRREVFHLDAVNPDDEAVVARMDCVVNYKAEVTQLITVPLDGENARVRATTFNH